MASSALREPLTLLRDLHARGLTVEVRDENLLVTPSSLLTEELRDEVHRLKPSLLLLLQKTPDLRYDPQKGLWKCRGFIVPTRATMSSYARHFVEGRWKARNDALPNAIKSDTID